MIFQTHIPGSPLDRFVEQFIYYKGLKRESTIDRFLPDGNCEIIIDLNDQPQFIYDNETLKEIQACHNVWASGVRTEPISIPSGNESEMFVIAFKRGMAFPFFPMPLNEIADLVVDADLIWGNEFAFLRELIFQHRNLPKKFEVVEEHLLRKIRERSTADLCVEFAVSEIVAKPDQVTFKELTSKIGYSQKHFISLFKRQVGVSPKNYLKIMRFQKAVNEVELAREVDWTSISIDCGFYDQAHFINDFKVFSGFTPAAYLQRKSDILNYVPVL